MRFILVTLTAFAFTLFLSAPNEVEAHSGGLNSQGCHAGSKPYHCHRSSSEMVGNRLRCDLGSRSSECKPKKDKPQDRNDAPSLKNNGVIDASDDLGTLPTYLEGGYGLVCLNSEGAGYHFIMSKEKHRLAFYRFENDKVDFIPFTNFGETIDEYKFWTSINGPRFTLNRQTLNLTRQMGDDKGNYDCKIISAIEMLDIAKERLKKKLSKNKL